MMKQLSNISLFVNRMYNVHLHVTPYYPQHGHMEVSPYRWWLIRAQQKLGHETSILTTDVLDAQNRNQLPLYRRENGIAILNLPNLRIDWHIVNYSYRPTFGTGGSLTPDIIHMHGHRHLLNNIAYTFAQKRSIPYVSHQMERFIDMKNGRISRGSGIASMTKYRITACRIAYKQRWCPHSSRLWLPKKK